MAERVSDERLAWLVREMGRLPEPHDPFDDELLVCLRELQALRREREWRPISEWHEDMGDVLWCRVPVEEPPAVTSPLSSDWINDFYTHFCRLPDPPHA